MQKNLVYKQNGTWVIETYLQIGVLIYNNKKYAQS